MKERSPKTEQEEIEPENTGKILLRANESMERFDRQLASSRKLARQIRKRLEWHGRRDTLALEED